MTPQVFLNKNASMGAIEQQMHHSNQIQKGGNGRVLHNSSSVPGQGGGTLIKQLQQNLIGGQPAPGSMSGQNNVQYSGMRPIAQSKPGSDIKPVFEKNASQRSLRA